jgi:non-ribosomal peptide synthetase component E (peptide arylation enzyme)
LAVGARLVHMQRWGAAAAIDLIEQEGISSLAGVPTLIQQILDELTKDGLQRMQSLEKISMAGTPVLPRLVCHVTSAFGGLSAADESINHTSEHGPS